MKVFDLFFLTLNCLTKMSRRYFRMSLWQSIDSKVKISTTVWSGCSQKFRVYHKSANMFDGANRRKVYGIQTCDV